jgi:hypothetical protein
VWSSDHHKLCHHSSDPETGASHPDCNLKQNQNKPFFLIACFS